MVLAPAARTSSPRRNAAMTSASRSDAARSFVWRSRTSSMPIISPRPRTSPMSRWRSRQVLEPCLEKFSHVGGVLHQAVLRPA